MKKYWLLLIIPVFILTLLISRSCKSKKPSTLEMVADSIRLTNTLADSARSASKFHFQAYETAIATYDNYLALPEPVKDSIRAAYFRGMDRADKNRAPGHGDTLRAAQTRSSQSQEKP